MKVLQRYLASEIIRAVLFVLLAFLALFAFFDLVMELRSIGRGNYRWEHAFMYVVLFLPTYAYELMPIAVLIGTIYALARLAANSEFTIMRTASMSTLMACRMLASIGLVFAVGTLLLGELVIPTTARMAEQVKTGALRGTMKQEFRSGTWTKDVIRENGLSGKQIGTRVLNVQELRADGQLRGLKIYEFDADLRLVTIILAESADYSGNNTWRLGGVTETILHQQVQSEKDAASGSVSSVSSKKLESRDLVTEVTPILLSVLFVKPERMSTYDILLYKKHLAENNQENTRYQIAFWKKIIYPFSIFVMMALALPFAYLHFRSGGISVKIFSGIMIGVGFFLANNLFSHVGMLNTWPAFIAAALPSSLFLLCAIGALWWVDRH